MRPFRHAESIPSLRVLPGSRQWRMLFKEAVFIASGLAPVIGTRTFNRVDVGAALPGLF